MLRLFLLLFALGLPLPLLAAPTDNPRFELGMVTGPQTGTYFRFGEDISRVTAASNIIISVKESSGSIDNLKRIHSKENAGLGIIQSDLLAYLRRSKNASAREMADKLRIVFSFYSEEVHLLARKDIKSFEELKGKRLIVGPEGSGHWLTAMNLLAMLDIQPASVQRMPMEEATLAVLRDRADALIFVGGKPVKLFTNLTGLADQPDASYKDLLSQVHFLPLRHARLMQDYEKAEITPEDYPFVKETVPTIAIRAVLVSFAFDKNSSPYAQERCNALGGIGLALRANLDYLKSYGHPKWKEVGLDKRGLGQWKPDPCVDLFKRTASAVNDPLERDLLQTIQKRW